MKFNLRIRLLLMVAIPLAGMLLVSLWNTVEKINLSADMKRLQGLVVVSTKIGALVHELQKERGMSAGFLGSKGENFARELPVQREVSDKRRKEVASSLADFDAARFGARMQTQVDAARQLLDSIDDKRQAVTAMSIPGPETIGFYTQTIAALLNISGMLPSLSSDKDIAQQASAYFALLQAKERAGIERAILSNAFGADSFSSGVTGTMVRFIRNSAEQDTWLGQFRQNASEAHADFASKKMQGAVVDEVSRFRKLAFDKLHEPSLGVDARQWFAASTARIDLMLEVEERLAADMNASMHELAESATVISWFYGITTVLAGLLVLFVSFAVTRRILAQIGGEPETAVAVAQAVAGGKLDNSIELAPGDTTSLLASMQRMQIQLLERLTAERRVAAENLRIRIALDNVSTGVMIADNKRDIIYVNKAASDVLRGAQEDIRKQLPGFDATKLLGSNIDTFHKNPAHQAKMLAEFTQTYTAHLELGGRHMSVSANPVIDPAGGRLGAVAEWRDHTQEVLAQAELKDLLAAALQGDFGTRIARQGKHGFFLEMADGMNQLMDTVVRAIEDIARVLNAVAHGDLSQTIDADYLGTLGQLKNDTNATVEQLRDVVGQIKAACEAIDIAAKEIAAGNADLSARTEEQASSLEETASSMEQINGTVKNNADNAERAASLARDSNAAAEKGGAMVGRVVETMSGIQASSSKIADIIGVINSIAFQTNILALNAAVEAARAGEQGRGFAVVATEVRNLAQRSADAAREIKTLIDESVGRVEGGVKLVHETGETIGEVVDAFKQLAKLVGGIAAASREQASGIEQVSNAVSQMDEVTQQNAALVEEAAAAAESLEEQARGLTRAVAMFRLDENQSVQLPAAVAPAPTVEAAPLRAERKPAASAKRLPPPHLDGDEDDWAEF